MVLIDTRDNRRDSLSFSRPTLSDSDSLVVPAAQIIQDSVRVSNIWTLPEPILHLRRHAARLMERTGNSNDVDAIAQIGNGPALEDVWLLEPSGFKASIIDRTFHTPAREERLQQPRFPEQSM